ncbi:hypothetical protein KSF_042930 [Reticulibacter mediterranei]|uniref:Uncharacterized protein n=1 Tax=Reticulibacter mediterranei TaxID=2778369 RepID=A0A8J3INZ1_9CHLR|nr:hypothetical protein KSF_042930 [Reticulibacter mediterranei]
MDKGVLNSYDVDFTKQNAILRNAAVKQKKSQNRKNGICYLCEKEAKQTPEGQLTRDRIPPECFAPELLASFTATSTSRFHYAFACRTCNNYYSDLEKNLKT